MSRKRCLGTLKIALENTRKISDVHNGHESKMNWSNCKMKER